jgi:hypothetical protein
MDALLPRKSAPDSTSQSDWVVRGTHLSFSFNTAIEAVRLSQAPIDGRLLGLLSLRLNIQQLPTELKRNKP